MKKIIGSGSNTRFKYSLMKGSKKFRCPKCGKKTFVPYVVAGTNQIVDVERFGRCERISSCQFSKYPKFDSLNDDDWTPPPPRPAVKITPDFVPFDVVEKTFTNFKQNPFFIYLVKIFGIDKAYELQEMYNIGTARNNGTTFAQIDSDGKCRTIKVFYYNEFGKRRKDKGSWYVHNRIKPDFQLKQVLFGEHLVSADKSGKKVMLVESEKSAIIMAGFYPEHIWIASGGAQMLSVERLTRIKRIDKVFPDNGQFELWQSRTRHIENVKMDGRVELAFQKGIIKAGDDILDLELIERGLDRISIKG